MMEKIILNNIVSTMSFNDKIREYKVSPVIIYSQLDDAKTTNIFREKSFSDSSCDNPDEFKIALGELYPRFKLDMLYAVRESMIESGVHYGFEDKFNEYFLLNQHMAAQLLQRLLRENYANVRIEKAVLHIVSHYTYDEIGDDFVFPISSLMNHVNKGIRKFALKVFDNWDAVETLSVLKGTALMQEKWLNDYKNRIIERLERKATNAIFFASN